MKTIKDVPMGIIIIVAGERFTRKPMWYDDNIPSKDFKRVDGGYDALEGQLEGQRFEIEAANV